MKEGVHQEQPGEAASFEQIPQELKMIGQESERMGGVLSRLNNPRLRSIIVGGLLSLSAVALSSRESQAGKSDWWWGYIIGAITTEISGSVAESWMKERYPEKEIVERLGSTITKYEHAKTQLEALNREIAKHESELPDLRSKAAHAELDKKKKNLSKPGYTEETTVLYRTEDELNKLRGQREPLQKKLIQLGSVIYKAKSMGDEWSKRNAPDK